MLIACVDQHMASSSSRDPMPSNAPENLSVQLWLPECFNSVLVDRIAQEDNEIHRGEMPRKISYLRFLRRARSFEKLSEGGCRNRISACDGAFASPKV